MVGLFFLMTNYPTCHGVVKRRRKTQFSNEDRRGESARQLEGEFDFHST